MLPAVSVQSSPADAKLLGGFCPGVVVPGKSLYDDFFLNVGYLMLEFRCFVGL